MTGFKWLVLALSCLTFAVSCTKKNTGKTPKNDTKIETGAVTAVDGKDGANPEATKTETGEDSITPPVLTTPKTPTTTATDVVPSTTTPAAVPSGMPSVTATPPATNPGKTEQELFEECVPLAVKNLIATEREKNQNTIEARKLFETKLATLKRCTRPASVSETAATSLVNKNITDLVNTKFLNAQEELDLFLEIENQDSTDSIKNQIYDDEWENEKALEQTVDSATLSAAPSAVVQNQSQPSSATTAPAAATVVTTPTQAAKATAPAATIPRGKVKIPSLSSALATPAPPPGPSDSTTKPAAAQAEAPAPSAQKMQPITLTDLPSFEACVSETGEAIIKSAKEKQPELESPLQLAMLRHLLLTRCQIKETAETNAVLTKVMNSQITAHFPKSKPIQEFYNLVMKTNYSQEVKITLLQYYNIPVELKFNNTKLGGVINTELTSGNTVAYTINQLGGEIQSIFRPLGKEAYTTNVALDKTPIENVSFLFDLNLNANQTGRLTINEGPASHVLEFIFVKGNLAQLKAGQNATVAFSQESWKRIMEAKIRSTIGIPKQSAPNFPIKYSVQNENEQQSRLCELTPKTLKCKDTNSTVHFKVTKETLN